MPRQLTEAEAWREVAQAKHNRSTVTFYGGRRSVVRRLYHDGRISGEIEAKMTRRISEEDAQ